MSAQNVIEVLELAFAPALFNGLRDEAWDKGVVITDLALARELAFDQNLPDGYRVWLDVIENCRGRLRTNPRFEEAHTFVSDHLYDLQQKILRSFSTIEKERSKR